MKTYTTRIETKEIREEWVWRRLMWDGSPAPKDTDTDKAIVPEDIRSALAALPDEDRRSVVGGAHADLERALEREGAAHAETRRERDEWKREQANAFGHATLAAEERDAYRAELARMRPVVDAAEVFNTHHWLAHKGAAGTPKREAWDAELRRLGEVLYEALQALRTASAAGPSGEVTCRGHYGKEGCGWTGPETALNGRCCPVCGGGHVEPAPVEPREAIDDENCNAGPYGPHRFYADMVKLAGLTDDDAYDVEDVYRRIKYAIDPEGAALLRERAKSAESKIALLAVMLGWGATPPWDVLERNVRENNRRLKDQAAEVQMLETEIVRVLARATSAEQKRDETLERLKVYEDSGRESIDTMHIPDYIRHVRRGGREYDLDGVVRQTEQLASLKAPAAGAEREELAARRWLDEWEKADPKRQRFVSWMSDGSLRGWSAKPDGTSIEAADHVSLASALGHPSAGSGEGK